MMNEQYQLVRIARLESRMDATDTQIAQLREWLMKFQGKADEHHRQVMLRLDELREFRDRRLGAQEQRTRMWQAVAILAAVLGVAVTFGWFGSN